VGFSYIVIDDKNFCWYKEVYSVVVSPLGRELSTRIQILIATPGLSHLNRWDKENSPRIYSKKVCKTV
jgi:hypothetical protein